jgi:hypothetical protein
MTKIRLAVLTGYQHSAGGFQTVLAALRAREMIETGASIEITDAGVTASIDQPAPPHGEALVSLWEAKLGKSARKSFSVLLAARGRALSAAEVAERAHYRVGTGGFNDGLKELRGYGLVEGTSRALALAAEVREDFL